MAKPSRVKVLWQSQVSPPPNSSSTNTSLPLTFLDIPWLLFSPTQTLFFYDYPHSTSHFLSTTLPSLSHSLSLSLHHFFPLAGNLSLSPDSAAPAIVCAQNDAVSFTVAKCDGDFVHFSGTHQRPVKDFHPLVPELATCISKGKSVVPLLAIQVTVFSGFGLCIGLAYLHVVADERTFDRFMKTWASFCKDTTSLCVDSPTCYDRTVVIDNHGLEEFFLNEWIQKRKLSSSQDILIGNETNVDLSNMVRATFVVDLNHMEKIKEWIVARCKKKKLSQPIHLSPYVLACALIWVCLAKTHNQEGNLGQTCFLQTPNYFGFVAGGITRVDFPVPVSYFGNCVGFGRSMVKNNDLLGEDGIISAANAIGSTIKKLDKDIFGEAKKWISDWEVLLGSELHVPVFGSPKVDLYGTDFGWGRARKVEEISIDRMRGISLTKSREKEGGIEVGLALPKAKMDIFASLFNDWLKLFY